MIIYEVIDISDIKEFKEIVPTVDLEGERIDFASLLDRTFIIYKYALMESQYGENGKFAIIQLKMGGKLYTTPTGSKVLLKQLERIRDELPVRVTLKKIKRYYTFS